MSQASKPVASLSLDLDNQWSYMKTHGDAGWQEFPTYLDLMVPRSLQLLREHGLTITYFIVGQDAALEKNHQALRAIAEAGHEVGNHSFRHEPWLHLYSDAELDTELERAEDALELATGQRPRGFRGPGYSLSEGSLRALARRGYRYDASTLPTFIGPVARAYYFATAKLSRAELDDRQKLFGTVRDGLRPIKPYCWELPEGRLLEIPVTTFPGVRVPIHFSYLLYLARYSEMAAHAYLRTALAVCDWAGVQPSLLFHPLDFLGGDDVSSLAFFPAMDMPGRRKVELLGRWVEAIQARFQVVTMAEHARRCETRPLPVFAGHLAGAAER
ncbi:MAG: polysaccharide deacetylase family protein [Bryobacterales bacterium]|nr:polysaccharide deacetylase family protein [Bryobacterales bacterium]